MHSWTPALVLGSLLCLSAAAQAQVGEDPDSSQSWLTRFAQGPARQGELWSGTVRATDDYGATHDRDFRLAASGSILRGDRKVVLNRYEPECLELAPAARLSLDDYCDQLTLTWRDGDATIAFSSLDANRRYAFTLRADPRSPTNWTSLTPSVPAPTLKLTTGASGGDVSYRWELGTRDATYRQAGEVTSRQLRDADLHPVEVGLLGLGEVLLTFNRYAFQFADLTRGDPNYQATAYAAWAEETVEGGCIFAFCFGNLGGGGGAGNNNNVCSPSSPSYNPALCPHDLTYSRWPVSQRAKVQKIDNNTVRAMHFVKNVGVGPFSVNSGSLVSNRWSFLSLIALGSAAPVVSPLTAGSALTGTCYSIEQTFFIGGADGLFQPFVDLDPGQSTTRGPTTVSCPRSTSRPAGRYRLYIHVDPDYSLDAPGFSGNNIGNSGPLDWVNLRD